jgi:hypothetical protein
VPRLKKIESLADVIRRLSPEEVPIAVSYLPLRDPTEKPLDEGWAYPPPLSAVTLRVTGACAGVRRSIAYARAGAVQEGPAALVGVGWAVPPSVGDPQQYPCFAGVGGCSGATCHRAPILRQSGLSCAILSLRLE